MATRAKTLRGFYIKTSSTSIGYQEEGLLSLLKKKVEGSLIADRKIDENKEDADSASIIMNSFEFGKNHCFGSIIKVKDGNETELLPKTFLEKNSVSLEELSSLDSDSFAIVYQYYFMLNNQLLVTDFYNNSETYPFEVYLNQLLKNDRDCLYELVPYIDQHPNIKPDQIKNCALADSYLNQQVGDETLGVTKNLSLKGEIIQMFFGEIDNIGGYKISDIVNPRLVFDVLKPKKISDEDFSNCVGRILKSVTNPDDLITELKGGAGKVKGGKLLKTQKVTVGITNNGYVDESSYSLMMEKFLESMK